MSCANNVLPVYMWPSPEKIPEALCLPTVQVDTVHFSPEATETNGFSRVSSSLNRTAVVRNTKTNRRAMNETVDMVIPIKNTPVKGAVEKLKMPSLASLISLRHGYLVKPAA